MSTRTPRRESDHNLGGDRQRPPPVEVPLDENTPPRRTTEAGADASRAATGRTVRGTILVLAVGALGGAGLSQGFAHSDRAPASTPTMAVPVLLRLHGEHLPAAPADRAPTADGTLVGFIVEYLDAIVETKLRLAHVAITDGPQQAAAMQFLRERHDDIRTIVLTNAGGALPYPMP